MVTKVKEAIARSKAALAKAGFNADQARDKDGKWTSGGGAGASGGPSGFFKPDLTGAIKGTGENPGSPTGSNRRRPDPAGKYELHVEFNEEGSDNFGSGISPKEAEAKIKEQDLENEEDVAGVFLQNDAETEVYYWDPKKHQWDDNQATKK